MSQVFQARNAKNGIASSDTTRHWIHDWGYWTPVFAYMALIFFLSSLSHPGEELPPWIWTLSDKVLHAGEYALLSLFVYRGLLRGQPPALHRRAHWFAIGIAVAYGASDELHQAFVPFRESDLWDLVADTVGSCLGVWTWRLLHAWTWRTQTSPKPRAHPPSRL
jgi:VanZ family protein